MRGSCAPGGGASWGSGGRGRGRSAAMRRAARPGVTLASAYGGGSGGGGWKLPSVALAAAVGFGVGSGVTYLLLKERSAEAPPARAVPALGDAAAALAHPAARHGLPSSSETIRVFDAFVSCWDARSRNPRWVAELLTRDGVRNGNNGAPASRNGVPFTEDAALPPRFRARLDDYRASGFDRGHMAAAANHRSSQAAMSSTFTLSNISPQVGVGFNRHYWARLEKFCRDLTKSYDTVHVITGPLFLPEPIIGTTAAKGDAPPPGGPKWRATWQFLGRPPALMAVPTHFYKVVYARGGSQTEDADVLGAFVLPNAPVPPGAPLTHYAVPLEALEAAAGLSFFDGRLGGPSGVARGAFADVEAQSIAALPPPPRHPLALPPPQGQLLLPPPPPSKAEAGGVANDAAAVSTTAIVAAPPQQQAQLTVVAEEAASPPPAAAAAVARAARRQGVPVPLCAAQACRLPAEAWWEPKKDKVDGGAAPAAGRAKPGADEE